jgi:zinc/manganese transport system substrate-binding protein
LAALFAPSLGWAAVNVVAAENFYGEAAKSLAGPDASVTSILSNPDEDPHLFEASPSVARQLAGARIAIVNGADYDPWMDTLLAAHAAPNRVVINVADLVGRKPGDNPHLWYDPAAMPAFAAAFTKALDSADPAHAAQHAKKLAAFLATLAPMDAKIAAIKAAHAGTPVTASEPVFGYMASALGLVMRNERFQVAVMNDAEPSPSDVAAFEQDLRGHAVRVMLYNSQADDAAVKRLVALARSSGVPVVGVTETEPAGKTYASWMLGQLDALDHALSGATTQAVTRP